MIGLFVLFTNTLGKKIGTYELVYEVNNNAKSLEHLGVLHATTLDIYKNITNFQEEITITEGPKQAEEEGPIEYKDNILDIDFSKGNNANINNYMENDAGTKQNEYTGLFKDKNIIYIVAESFHTIGVSKDRTPTLYSLIHDGWDFENFYVPNNLSTIGGEFQALTSLYADQSFLSTWRKGTNYFPYGLASTFQKEGYDTFAYHNNSYTFQDRNVYLKSQGFYNFKGCYNGMEKLINCERWPQSDVDMIDQTTSDYLDTENPFLAYYMTVSGHLQYTFSGNSIATKNRAYVDNLPYSEKIKGYLATQIELDKALELLINRLQEKNILDDTVIVLLADHYPYGLTDNEIAEVSTYDRDSTVELHHNSLIIWNSTLAHKSIEKTCMSIDVLPTVYNLFGIKYDSRLLMGKDIFSTTEGLAILNDRSWVSDQGTYFASTRTFIPKNDNVSQDYIEWTNNRVANRLNISKMIMASNYYNSFR